MPTGHDIRASQRKDFVPRERKPTLGHLFAIFLITLLVAVCLVLSLYDRMALIAILVTMAGFVSWYATLHVEKNREMMAATEFQNALFAGALNLHCTFCLIVKDNGEIVYFNRAFQDMFPEFLKQPDPTLSALLSVGQAPADVKTKVLDAVEHNRKEETAVKLQGEGGARNFALSITPLERPAGFSLVSARAA